MNSFIDFLLTAVALLIPVGACIFLCLQLKGKTSLNWQTIACFSGFSIISSLLLLLVAGEIEFLRYGETQVNRKLDEVKKLTEQNQQMAIKTVELISRATAGSLQTENYDANATYQSQVELLKSVGLSDSEIENFFTKLNQTGSKTNAP